MLLLVMLLLLIDVFELRAYCDIVELRRELRPGGKNGMQNRWATWHKMAASGVFTERPEFSRSPKSLCVDIGPELCGVMMSGDKAWRCC